MQDLDAQLVDPPAKPAQAVIALGSNLGQSRRILHDAVEGFRQADNVWVTAVSPLAKTAPVGGPEQPDFLNQVLIIQTRLSAHALLEFGQALEQAAQRVRTVRWGPRTLDVDLIAYEGVTSNHPVLTLPHPRAHQRAFVLIPGSWGDPGASLAGRSVAQRAAPGGGGDPGRRRPESPRARVVAGGWWWSPSAPLSWGGWGGFGQPSQVGQPRCWV